MAFAGRIGPLNRWLLACLAVCVGIGVLAGINPEYGLVGALGVMLAVITIMDLTLGFVLFTIASFLDLTSSTGSFSGIKVVGLVLFVSWLARIGTRRSTEIRSFAAENPMLAASLVAMLGWAALELCVGVQPEHGAGRGRSLRARHDAAADRLRRDARAARRGLGARRLRRRGGAIGRVRLRHLVGCRVQRTPDRIDRGSQRRSDRARGVDPVADRARGDVPPIRPDEAHRRSSSGSSCSPASSARSRERDSSRSPR